MENITKVFPGVVANDGVSFDLEPGEVHALVGENGAGKTTLMKILYGLYSPDEGGIFVNDKPTTISGPRNAIDQGIGMVHQHFMLVPVFSVLDNIILGEERTRGGAAAELPFWEKLLERLYLEKRRARKRITELMERNQLDVELDRPASELPVGVQQRVEILKILYRGAQVLVFDEPTAVLTPQEVEGLFATFKELKAQGKGIIFISHKLDEVLQVADRITVIRRGKVIHTMPREGATKAQIAELMVGKPVLLKVDNPEAHPGEEVLRISGLTAKDERGATVLQDVSLNVRAGEIVGIAGVEGNGQTELVRCIAERENIQSGEIALKGEVINAWDVRERREAGIAHIPEDRHRFGLLMPFTLADNLVLGRHHEAPFVGALGWRNRKAIREFAREAIGAYDVRAPGELTPALALSGGNQQKVIIAREMSGDPALLLASQPTRGVDIGATEFIYKQIVQAKVDGRAVLLVSADLDEILSLSDRILVMYKGQIVHEVSRSEATKEKIGFYMMGAGHGDSN
jgi:simple sugar transport system ATP-binding protein